ncbi:hypothetical protein LTS18_008809, partial [Coniosporium uncinatum]
YTNSPRKRKAQGAHQPAPAPTSAPQYTSPSFSQMSSSTSTPGRRGHGRQRSDASARGYEALSRRAARQQDNSGRPNSGHSSEPQGLDQHPPGGSESGGSSRGGDSTRRAHYPTPAGREAVPPSPRHGRDSRERS